MKEIEDLPEPARMRGGRAATSGAEPSAAVEGDPLLIEMARALHSHLPEDQRPVARMDFSDDQWARLEAAADVIRAPLLKALEPFAKIAGPINGEAGRPTYLDTIMKGETEELAVTTIFDTGGRGAVLWADDFREALAALERAR